MASDYKMGEITHAADSKAIEHVEDKESSQLTDDDKPFTWQSVLAVCVCTIEGLFLSFEDANAITQAIIAVYQGYLFTLVMPNSILAFINEDLGPSPIYTWISVR
jgi:hypothetical protein